MAHIQNILGVETTRDIGMLAWGILSNSWQESFTTRDMRILCVGLFGTLVVILLQVYVAIFVARKISWWQVLGAVIFDVVVFATLVIGQVKFAYWMLDVKAPRAIVVERVSPTLVSVNWKTYDPEYSMVLWGYDPERLYDVELGVGHHLKDRRHEVLIDTEPGKEVYLKIMVGEEVYGINSKRNGAPYGVMGGE